MKQLIIVALLVAAAMAKDYEAMFRGFKAAHLKSYASAAEEKKRFLNFVENMAKAEVLQAANPLATFGVNKFADISDEEFKNTYYNGEEHFSKAMARPRDEVTISKQAVLAAQGKSIDWREKGAVTPVKNQGHCGSCWAFSATGNIEGVWFLAGHPLTPVSEQELVSCDTIDHACNGGLMDNAFNWLINARKGQIVTGAAYPYTSGNGDVPSCKVNNEMEVGAVIKGFKDLPHSEDAMAAWMLEHGPLAIAVDATSFKTYNKGIVTKCISNRLNHGVLAVGFDATNVPPYWIVKNSWGVGWGEEGYIRIAKGSNQCLISEYATTAIAADKAATTSAGSIIQMECSDAKCSANCQNHTFPLQTCLHLGGGGSAIVSCTEDLISLVIYPETENCKGRSQKSTMPTKQCLPSMSNYIENFCALDKATKQYKLKTPLFD